MTSQRRLPAAARLISLALAAAACSSQSSTPTNSVSYNAILATDDRETTVQLVKLTADGAGTVEGEILGEVGLGYGEMPFLLGQGKVPGSGTVAPPECLVSQSMGPGMIDACVTSPALTWIDWIAGQYAIPQDEVVITASYDTSSSESYQTPLVDAAATATDVFAEGLGYTSSIIPEEPEPEIPEAAGASSDFYNHDRNVRNRPERAETWISELRESARLSQLSIPGTHDSAAWKHDTLGGPVTQTQSMDIPTQLKAGVRFLDIRLKCLVISGRHQLKAFHGLSPQEISFDEIIGELRDFLATHRREVVYVRIKNESGGSEKDQYCLRKGMPPDNETFRNVFKSYFINNGDVFWTPPGKASGGIGDPTLGETRGRVVIIKDFVDKVEDVNFGLVWAWGMEIQDEFHVNAEWEIYSKWNKIRQQLERARSVMGQETHPIFINFLSASGDLVPLVHPWFVASGQRSPNNGDGRRTTSIAGCKGEEPEAKTMKDFPRRCELKIPKFKKCGKYNKNWCEIDYMGMNELAALWFREENYTDFSGIVVADFIGGDLIYRVIDINRHKLLDTAPASGPAMEDKR